MDSLKESYPTNSIKNSLKEDKMSSIITTLSEELPSSSLNEMMLPVTVIKEEEFDQLIVKQEPLSVEIFESYTDTEFVDVDPLEMEEIKTELTFEEKTNTDILEEAEDHDNNKEETNKNIGLKEKRFLKAAKPQKYPCKTCSYIGNTKKLLKRHTEFNHEGIVFKCDECEHTASSSTYMKTHKDNVHKGLKYLCAFCSFQATDRNYLKIHEDSLHLGVKYECDICHKQSTSKSGLRKHVKSIHTEFKYPCENCEYKATDLQVLKKHKMAIHGNIRFQCKDCSYDSGFKSDLRVHINSVHLGIRYPCNNCGKEFKRKSLMKKHAEKCNKKNEVISSEKSNKNIEIEDKIELVFEGQNKYWKCKICEKTMNRSDKMALHVEIHLDGKGYKCLGCDETFKTQNSINVHEAKRSKKILENLSIKCKSCDFITPDSCKMRAHNRSHTSGTEQDLNSKVDKHIEKVDGIWKCKVCGKTFKSKTKLRYHVETHIPELKYTCTFCDMQLNTRNSREDHIRRKHKNILEVEVNKANLL